MEKAWIPITNKMSDNRHKHASAIDSESRKLYVTGGLSLGARRRLDTAEVNFSVKYY